MDPISVSTNLFANEKLRIYWAVLSTLIEGEEVTQKAQIYMANQNL